MVIWLIGLSGSGKTTLSEALYRRLKPKHANLVLLDGDAFREVFRDVDHTIEGRRRNAERISNLCKVLDDQGIHVIAAVLSLFPEWQAWNRTNFSNYFEVFLDLPLKTLKERDTKDLYAAAEAGRMTDVVGIDIPFPRPAAPDLVIDKPAQDDGVEACLETILAQMPPLA
jgi:adenylylsulfate kinase-like enzyme